MLRNYINFCLEYLELGALDYLKAVNSSLDLISIDSVQLEQGRGCRRTCRLRWVKFLFFLYLFLFAHGIRQMQAKYKESAVFCEVKNYFA